MNRLVLILLISLCACRQERGVARTVRPPCTRPESFGAVADDGEDDRLALQAAIITAQLGPKCLELGLGTYHVTWLRGDPHNTSLYITGQLDISGAPGGTTLAMLGTAIGPNGNPRGWRLLNITGTDIRVHDLNFEGGGRSGTNEQTHLIQVLAPSDHVTIDHVNMDLPSIGPLTGGDCIRLLGAGDNVDKVRNTTISDVLGAVCDRSFISFQRGVEGVVVADSISVEVGQSPIDFEPTGTSKWECAPSIKDVLIRDSMFGRGADAQGAVTVSISGDGCSKAENITVERTHVLDGTLHLLDVKNVLLMDLDLKNRIDQVEPVFRAMKRAEGVRLINSRVERLPGSVPGNVITVVAANGALPTDVQLDGVTVIQNVPGIPIEFISGRSLIITKSSCVYQGPAPAPISCVLARGVEQSVGRPLLVDSTWKGTTSAARVTGTNDGRPLLVRTTRVP